MKQLLYLLLLTIVTISNSACRKDTEPATNPEVEAYLITLMPNMERYSINRKTLLYGFDYDRQNKKMYGKKCPPR